VILCVVTDRRRLGGSLDALVEQARAAAAAPIDLLHLRERDLEAAALVALAARILEAARGSRMRVVINDRVDVALACGADGVHLRGDSMPTAAARALAPPPIVLGRSIHTIQDASAAGDVDYLVAGSVFPSASKPGADRWLGADGLRAIVKAARAPVLAIGGVTLEKVADLAAAGAAGVAAIGLFSTIDATAMHRIACEVRSRFDSVKTAS